MSRLALSEPSIGSQTTRQGCAGPEHPLAELLGDEREVLVERLEPVHDRGLGGRVDRRRVVAALALASTGSRSTRVGSSASTRLDVADRVAAHLEPRLHSGWKSRPEISFGKKYVVFCGSTSPRRAWAKTSSIRVGRSR